MAERNFSLLPWCKEVSWEEMRGLSQTGAGEPVFPDLGKVSSPLGKSGVPARELWVGKGHGAAAPQRCSFLPPGSPPTGPSEALKGTTFHSPHWDLPQSPPVLCISSALGGNVEASLSTDERTEAQSREGACPGRKDLVVRLGKSRVFRSREFCKPDFIGPMGSAVAGRIDTTAIGK